MSQKPQLNIFGEEIKECSCSPMTGWFRDGHCHTDLNDHGIHTICCKVNIPFLQFLKSKGNDLITPNPQHGFPGLKDGDSWCVCAGSWLDAYKAGVACMVNLQATHEETLAIIPKDVLIEYGL
jgi:hypothetical protein